MVNRMNMDFSHLADPQEMVEHYPMSSLMVAFGLGITAGLLLSNVFTEEEETRSERYRRQIVESLGSVLPDALRRSLTS